MVVSCWAYYSALKIEVLFASVYNVCRQNSARHLLSRRYLARLGRAIAEAVSRCLPTAAARDHARVWQVGFVVDEMASGQFFSEYFGFPCQNHSFHQLHHHHNHPGQLAESFRRADHPSKESTAH
jgi:hypothetical protein